MLLVATSSPMTRPIIIGLAQHSFNSCARTCEAAKPALWPGPGGCVGCGPHPRCPQSSYHRQRTGRKGKLAFPTADPVHQFARAGPRRIQADQALSVLRNSGVNGCTTSMRHPVIAGVLTVHQTEPITRRSTWASPHWSIQVHLVDNADDGVVDGLSLQPSAMAGAAAGDRDHAFADTRATVSDADHVAALVLPVRRDRLEDEELLASRRGSLRVATTVPTTRARIMGSSRPVTYRALRLPLAIGRMNSRLSWGRGITCTAINSPTRRAAAAPASVAARTAATSRAPWRSRSRSRSSPTHQVHLGSLHHGVGGLDHGYQAARFDHS